MEVCGPAGPCLVSGSFVYVPAGSVVDIPLQSRIFRLNAAGANQFEHTLIILEPGFLLTFYRRLQRAKFSPRGQPARRLCKNLRR